MFWRVFHDFLKWLWPATFTALFAVVALVVAASEVWPEAKTAVGDLFAQALAMLNSPWTWVFVALAFFVWLAAFIWSGHKIQADKQSPNNKRNLVPLYKVVQWIAKNSIWAENYSGEDDAWVIALTDELQTSLSLGEVESVGYLRVQDYLDGGLTEIAKEEWKSPQWDTSSFSLPIPIVSIRRARYGEQQTGGYLDVRLNEKQVKEKWPRRSFKARLFKQSPIERIEKSIPKNDGGGYKALFRQQDENYPKTLGWLKLPTAERFYAPRPE